MSSVLEQFLSESRDLLVSIGDRLMQLESTPARSDLMTELFRCVHTLKGNSGLFEYPEMTRVLHVGEDLMSAVREGEIAFSSDVADRLLDAVDFVALLLDEIESHGNISGEHGVVSSKLAEAMRDLLPVHRLEAANEIVKDSSLQLEEESPFDLGSVSLAALSIVEDLHSQGCDVIAIEYSPNENIFFQGGDPLHECMEMPGLFWGDIFAKQPWADLPQLDPYCCSLSFRLLVAASLEDVSRHFCYVLEDVKACEVKPEMLSSRLKHDTRLRVEDGNLLESMHQLVAVQRRVLALPVEVEWHWGRVRAAMVSLVNCMAKAGSEAARESLKAAIIQAEGRRTTESLLKWIDQACESWLGERLNRGAFKTIGDLIRSEYFVADAGAVDPIDAVAMPDIGRFEISSSPTLHLQEVDTQTVRRADEHIGMSKSLKVDQAKIERLMNLIGEMVVSKNSLPYLAARAEQVFGCRELAKEIKAQHSVINRIAEEMQDAIMQIRMVPVCSVFQRFPRLVRDISKRLCKDVSLILEGEETEVDKNIVESLGDPLIHIVRNSLDHGLESSDARVAAGKSPRGTLCIRAAQESDHVIIEISDDGKGIDPIVIKQKAYQKGLIDESTLERISDQDAINLVFMAGFSTADVVSDLSGRGVGMDAVRSAIQRVNGQVQLSSEVGKGTCIRLSLPLSMAVTNVMIVESNRQIFGVPMDCVVETVRISRKEIKSIKCSMTTVLRRKIVPLRELNELLGIDAPQVANADEELAILIVRIGEETVGLIVDDFQESLDIILKPLTSVLGRLNVYSGSALMGDGSVLMVLNIGGLL